jgi:hypothetical protein
VFGKVICASVLKGDKDVTWGEFEGYIGTIVESHGDLLAEDRVKDMMCLDVMCDSVEPLGVMVSNADKLLPTFKVESPQEFVVTPVIC